MGPHFPSRPVVTDTGHTTFADRSLHNHVTLHITSLFFGQLQSSPIAKVFPRYTSHTYISSRATSPSASHHSRLFTGRRPYRFLILTSHHSPSVRRCHTLFLDGYICARNVPIQAPTQQIPEGAPVAISVSTQCVTVQTASQSNHLDGLLIEPYLTSLIGGFPRQLIA